eukprot:TRINITY_DN34720_c1_g1_i1.p1 TRINITY_DN34720_c1_g1~~TRINITY_DN34720_c1_g1_i1.p1  ORF type:complete len:357 (-),score=65.98 TRINITY_DN34720_c1_g1_i1:199-1269(-)
MAILSEDAPLSHSVALTLATLAVISATASMLVALFEMVGPTLQKRTPETVVVALRRVFHMMEVLLRPAGRVIWRCWVNHKRRVILSDWQELEFAPLELRSERHTAHMAVKQDWRALEFVSKELCNDKEIVHDAVRQSWRALRFASLRLRGDREIVLGAVEESNGWALEFAAEELYQDPELMRVATTRLGGHLGLPLTPILTLVPTEGENAEEGGGEGGAQRVQPTQQEEQQREQQSGNVAAGVTTQPAQGEINIISAAARNDVPSAATAAPPISEGSSTTDGSLPRASSTAARTAAGRLDAGSTSAAGNALGASICGESAHTSTSSSAALRPRSGRRLQRTGEGTCCFSMCWTRRT